MYSELENARAAVRAIGESIAQGTLPRALGPLVFTFTGTGSVAQVQPVCFVLFRFFFTLAENML